MSELLFGFRDLINSTDPKYWSLFDFRSVRRFKSIDLERA